MCPSARADEDDDAHSTASSDARPLAKRRARASAEAPDAVAADAEPIYRSLGAAPVYRSLGAAPAPHAGPNAVPEEVPEWIPWPMPEGVPVPPVPGMVFPPPMLMMPVHQPPVYGYYQPPPAWQQPYFDRLSGRVVNSLQTQQGSRDVQHALECLPSPWKESLAYEMRGHVRLLALNPYGSRGVRKAVEVCDNFFFHDVIRPEVVPHLCELSTDTNGGPLVQHVLDVAHARGSPLLPVVDAALQGDIVHLAMDRFGNHVVKKLLLKSSPSDLARLMDALMPHIGTLALDEHGSWVAKDLVFPEMSALVFGNDATLLGSLLASPSGRHVLVRLVKCMPTADQQRALKRVQKLTTDDNHGACVAREVTH